MSGRSFRSVFMVASCAGAALGCYLVSLRVASERSALENVENRIVMTQRDIRLLQTEIGTRGRLAQLERWNAKVLALSAPSADQFLGGSFELAKLMQPEHKIDPAAPVVLASAPMPQKASPMALPERGDDMVPPAGPAQLLHEASYRKPERLTGSATARIGSNAAPTRFAPDQAVAKPRPAPTQAAVAKPPAKPAAKPAAKPMKLAANDPLAPLPIKPQTKPAQKPAKDTGQTQ
jgi:hypothetical protein